MEPVTTLTATQQIFIAFIPLLAVIIGWLINEGSKQGYDRKKSKELKYVALLESSIGFYDSVGNTTLKNKFLRELNLAWLYCPDHIIHKCYGFLETVTTDTIYSDVDKEKAFKELVLALRKETYGKKTKLAANDYKLLRST